MKSKPVTTRDKEKESDLAELNGYQHEDILDTTKILKRKKKQQSKEENISEKIF
jgi:hypothetical protein